MKHAISLLLVILLFCTAAHAETFSDPSRNFTLEIPARFHRFTGPPNTLAAFATSDPANGMPDEMMTIMPLGGVIGREHLKASDLPASAQGIPFSNPAILSAKWKTFDIDVISMHASRNGVVMATRTAQIPLKNEAIQIIVAVPATQEAKADATLNELLATLDGPSNWLTPADRAQRLGVTCGVLVGALVVGIVLLVKFLRRKPTA